MSQRCQEQGLKASYKQLFTRSLCRRISCMSSSIPKHPPNRRVRGSQVPLDITAKPQLHPFPSNQSLGSGRIRNQSLGLPFL